MKFVSIFALFVSFIVSAQPNTEVYVLDLERSDTTFSVSNLQNITNNEGYDNQPSFIDNNKVLYAGSENGQTEIQYYHLSTNTTRRINAPTSGGEYSPRLMPNGTQVAAVRLDTTGLQRLYAYDLSTSKNGNPEMLLSDLEVAYYDFYDEDWLVASVLSGDRLDLVIANVPNDEAGIYVENSGRSIHKVPTTKTVSYTVVNEEKNHDVYVVDVEKAGDTFFVCQLPVGVQDHAWLDATTLLLGSGSKLYSYDMFGPGAWLEVADLSEYNLKNITRLAVSPDGTKIALVAEKSTPSPDAIVNRHIDPFNQGELDSFAQSFAENVVVQRFPSDTMYVGREALQRNYENFFRNNSSWNVAVNNRIVHNEMVIDEELVMVNGKKHRQATLYETKDGLIQSMTFISDNTGSENPELVLATIKKDRDVTIVNKIIAGNLVICHEMEEVQGTNTYSVTIYEVEKGEVKKTIPLK